MGEINETILLRYLEGQLDRCQEEEVRMWIAFSEENRKTFEKIYMIWFATGSLKIMKSVNAYQALRKVNKRMKSDGQSWIVYLQRVAAILFLPLLLCTVYLLFPEKESETEYVEIKTNPGMLATFRLPDGSEVWLNGDSYLKYPAQFQGKQRRVDLDGEAYFKVKHNEKQHFIVSAGKRMEIEVLGTEFNLEAYSADNFISTTLLKGSVQLNYKIAEVQQCHKIIPSEKAIFSLKDEKLQVGKVNVETEVAWKDGKIIFRNTSMQEALRMLSRRYNVCFRVKKSWVYENNFTGTFEHQRLEQILEHFRIASGIHYRFVEPNIQDRIPEKRIVELY